MTESAPPSSLEAYEQLLALNRHVREAIVLLNNFAAVDLISGERVSQHAVRLQYLLAVFNLDLLAALTRQEEKATADLDAQIRALEQSGRDPDDVYLEVARRERERKLEGLPPRIRFLDKPSDAKKTIAGGRSKKRKGA